MNAPLARSGARDLGDSPNPFLFIVGAARSGTTLLQRMLDAHPLLTVVNETYWLPRKYRERTGLTRDGLVTPALFPLLRQSPKFGRMGLGDEDLWRIAGDGLPSSYAAFVARLFDEYAKGKGSSWLATRRRDMSAGWPSSMSYGRGLSSCTSSVTHVTYACPCSTGQAASALQGNSGRGSWIPR